MQLLVLSEVQIYGDALDSLLRTTQSQMTVTLATSIGGAVIEMEKRAMDAVLLDVGADGVLQSLSALRRRWPQTLMVAFGLSSSSQEVICSGASMNYIFGRQVGIEEMLSVLSHERPPNRRATPPSPQPTMYRLTPREREVADLLSRGLSNKEIARDLRIELATVKNHVHSLLRKTDARTRLQAVVNIGAAFSMP
ncbi:response regulator transcription factor [Xanthomonas hortorum]|uniref:response regulator transcription factor n=1 Tax=Xanthomonas hortorum TaxID=56454 RepID=UPI001E3A277A|nr:response regulator transcription factor [Xanthomonas hortorum]MCC8552410.1 response regulator transcription factor [Xanthomonas hortorum pv. gardneri]